MTVKIQNDYYIKRKSKLMKDFSSHIEIARDILKKKFSETKINNLYEQMKKEYEKIIPEIPFIGGTKNPFSTLLIGGMSSLAIFRVLEKERFSLRDIGEFYYEFRDKHNTIRKNSLEKIGKDPSKYPFEPAYMEWAKKQCEISQSRAYPDDWVEDYIEGDGKTFEWGFNFHECGFHKVFKRLGAEKFVPFFCLADFSEANILGFGFSRTQTIGFGASFCDHRYVKDYATPKRWPPDNLPEFNKDVIP
ncbi:MAG: L-2-amino-thiazoline-4-carboxylic acid hydrolase [Candidatus Thorarchaeota archaeon]